MLVTRFAVNSSNMEDLYLSGFKQDNKLHLPAASIVTLFIKEYLKTEAFRLHFVSNTTDPTLCPVTLPLGSFCNTSTLTMKDCPQLIHDCTLPAVKCCHGNKVLSGLCGVLRYILKTTAKQESTRDVLQLLGHKQICLKACAEVSLWTKFCEVDIPKAVHQIISKSSENVTEPKIPVELLKLERQFQEPCIVANRNKQIHKALKLLKIQNKADDVHPDNLPGVPKHNFVEGPDITLADLALLPCIALILDKWKDYISQISEHLPHTTQWVELMLSLGNIEATFMSLNLPKPLSSASYGELYEADKVILPDLNKESLMVRQSKIRKFRVKSTDLHNILQKISYFKSDDLRVDNSYDIQLNWHGLPEAVHPRDGDLPKERLERKCQQLENLAAAVQTIAKPGDTVVDFCAGGGHLGILLAYLLPKCKVILIENKEESIQRAEERIEKLQLQNIVLYQCNLDYFTGKFDIGVCLHACGVATDLVLRCCLNNSASFVICPCCYGSIHNTHTVSYPQSNLFKKAGLTYEEYLGLGHGADQTQFSIPAAEQGRLCMTYIDMDRAHLAMECNYTVTLAILKPPECSPKNNLLIGKAP